ncbi:hypothetical protein CEXT_255431 [Caerostris extrusa]|uniref:Uncharacterized protein n=1 Tax=Caerostris extrusa TaxID=172846 RepID=A0AAV4WLJ3_CAEEX|nr:hypothetical protein CEXT_255431 [Caerostris extrusa]
MQEPLEINLDHLQKQEFSHTGLLLGGKSAAAMAVPLPEAHLGLASSWERECKMSGCLKTLILRRSQAWIPRRRDILCHLEAMPGERQSRDKNPEILWRIVFVPIALIFISCRVLCNKSGNARLCSSSTNLKMALKRQVYMGLMYSSSNENI